MSIKDITLGRYVHGDSILHRLDPRTKLLCLLILMIALLSSNRPIEIFYAGLFTILACILSGLPFSYLLRSIMPFKWLILITVILKMLFVGGHIIVEAPLPYGGLTLEGLEQGSLYGARIALLVLTASLLTLTTEPIVLVDGIEKLLYPLSFVRLKPHEAATAMVITIRFIPVLLDEAVKIRKSHIARGFNPGKSTVARLKSVTILLLPLFTSSIRRAEMLAVAMDCRLFRSSAPKSKYREIRMLSRDWAALVFTFIACGLILF